MAPIAACRQLPWSDGPTWGPDGPTSSRTVRPGVRTSKQLWSRPDFGNCSSDDPASGPDGPALARMVRHGGPDVRCQYILGSTSSPLFCFFFQSSLTNSVVVPLRF